MGRSRVFLIGLSVRTACLKVVATAGTSAHTTFGESDDQMRLCNRSSYRHAHATQNNKESFINQG